MKTFTISDFCDEFNVSRRTIRFYVERGLLSPSQRDTKMIFRQRDHTRLRLILRGKRFAFSLREIKEILDLYDGQNGKIVQLQAVLPKLKSQLELMQAEKQALIETIGELESSYSAMETTLQTLLDAGPNS